MIPPPKLDDRNLNDIVEEAISMIPRYSPEWTNHNPSDPGITLIELAAWMTDLLIYRLNQVPDKNYVAFLNLLGIKLRAPRAAKALVRFTLVEGAAKQRVPRGTQVSTPRATEEHTVTFETERDVMISIGAAPDRCFSYFDEAYSENTRFIDPGTRDDHRFVRRVQRARSGSSATSISAIRGSRPPARRRCSGCFSGRPSAAAATWRDSSSGSTGTAAAGRISGRR